MSTTTTTTTTTTNRCMMIENKLQDAFISLLSAAPWIVAEGISVQSYADNTNKHKSKYLIVHTAPVKRIAPNFPMWECEVEITALTHIPEDLDSAIMERLYNEALLIINTVTKEALSTASGLTIDGIVPSTEGGDDNFSPDTEYQSHTAKGKIYLTFNPVIITTTTTI